MAWKWFARAAKSRVRTIILSAALSLLLGAAICIVCMGPYLGMIAESLFAQERKATFLGRLTLTVPAHWVVKDHAARMPRPMLDVRAVWHGVPAGARRFLNAGGRSMTIYFAEADAAWQADPNWTKAVIDSEVGWFAVDPPRRPGASGSINLVVPSKGLHVVFVGSPENCRLWVDVLMKGKWVGNSSGEP